MIFAVVSIKVRPEKAGSFTSAKESEYLCRTLWLL
jgi:hypothetical protein